MFCSSSYYKENYGSLYFYFLQKMAQKNESNLNLLQSLKGDYKESVKILSYLFDDMGEKDMRKYFLLNKSMNDLLLLLSNDAHSSTIKLGMIDSVLEMFSKKIKAIFKAASIEYVAIDSNSRFPFNDDLEVA